jgi:hypothetical protein
MNLMDEFEKTIIRIEAVEIPYTDGGTLALRVDSRIAGHVKASLEDRALRLVLKAADTAQTHVLQTRRATLSHDSSGWCFICPSCSRWRKRLFLIERGDGVDVSFRCKQCARARLRSGNRH